MSGSLIYTPEAEAADEEVSRLFVRPRTVDDADQFMDAAQGLFDTLGMRDAADNMRRYRSGSGQRRVFSSEEVERYPEFSRAEDTNRSRFESQTFTGTTENPSINQQLQSLEDGQSTDLQDNWDRAIDFPNPFSRSSRDRYMAFGRTGVRSRGNFTARRDGDDISITGTVRHGLQESAGRAEGEEMFDFNQNQPGHTQARILEDAGQAAPFPMSYSRTQDVTARVRRQPDGSLVLQGTTWGPMR